MQPQKKPRLGDMLVDAKVISRPQLEEALRVQRIYGGKLGTNLVELGYVDEAFLSHFLSEKLGIHAVSVETLKNIPPDVLATISKELAAKYKVIPFRLEKRALDVAMVDPTDLAALDELSFATGLQVRPHVGTEVLVVHAMEQHYGIPREQRYLRLNPEQRSPSGLWSKTAPPGGGHASHLGPSLPDCIQALFNVEDKDQIIEVILRFGTTFFSRMVVFLLRTNYVEGYRAHGPDWLRQRCTGIQISLLEPNIFQNVFESQTHFMGVVPPHPSNSAILGWLGEDPTLPVFMVPLVFQNRAELILYASPVDQSFTPHELQRFLIMMEKATLAVHLLVLKRRMRVLPEGLV